MRDGSAMSVAHVLLVLTLLVCSLAHSQPPTPAPAKGSAGPQAQSNKSKQAATADQRGTANVPLVVHVLPTQKTQAEATQEAEDREAEATNKRWSLIFSGLLVMFTVVLAVSTIFLYKATAKTADAAKASADAAATSAKTAAADFVIGNRPKLVVRRIYFRDETTIAYEVANIGGIEATIQSAKAATVVDRLPSGDPDIGEPYQLAPAMIHAGSKHEFMHMTNDEAFSFAMGFGSAHGDTLQRPSIYFLGSVAYKDRLGISRRTAFCRRYDFERERFMPMEDPDPDYEHVD